MDKLVNLSVRDYTDLLASLEPAPGGGSTAALLAAQGAALTAMVCGLTLGKKKYEEHQALCSEVRSRADALKGVFLDFVDRDTEAYGHMNRALALPRDTEEDKAVRAMAMQEALKLCTQTPYDLMEDIVRMADLLLSVTGKSNASAASDLGVAALCLGAAVQGAWLNVLINLGGIKDADFVRQYRQNGQMLAQRVQAVADSVFTGIRDAL